MQLRDLIIPRSHPTLPQQFDELLALAREMALELDAKDERIADLEVLCDAVGNAALLERLR